MYILLTLYFLASPGFYIVFAFLTYARVEILIVRFNAG